MSVKGMAHRGYPLKHPENTLRGFRTAQELGFTHLELDVHLTKDGVPVVIHDPTVDRTTNGHGRVNAFTLHELKELDAGGERIPTLEEALTLAKGNIIVDVELKQSGDAYPGLEQAVLDVIRDVGTMQEVIITSFDHYAIERVRALDPDVAVGLVIYGASPSVFPYLKELRAAYLSVKHTFVTPEYMERCRQEGIQLILWTPDDEHALQTWARYPELLICTNNLEGWMDTIQEHVKV